MNEVLRQLGTISQCQTPTRLGGQIGERQKDARLRLSGTARRKLKMKTGGLVLPFSFFRSRRASIRRCGGECRLHIATNPKAQNLRSVSMQSGHLWTSGLGRPATNDPLRSFTPDNIGSVRSMGHQRAPSVPFAIKNKIAD